MVPSEHRTISDLDSLVKVMMHVPSLKFLDRTNKKIEKPICGVLRLQKHGSLQVQIEIDFV